MALIINDNINSRKTNLANLDTNYGPYTSVENAINTLVPNKSTLDIANGYTFGVKGIGDTEVTEYAFYNIATETTSADIRANFNDYVKRKVNNTKVILKDTNGVTIGQFTLNQASNGDIEITIPSQVTVDQVYNAVSQNAQSGTAVAEAILEKANTNDVIERVSGHTNEIPTLTSTGTLQGSGKTMENVVFFEDVN